MPDLKNELEVRGKKEEYAGEIAELRKRGTEVRRG